MAVGDDAAGVRLPPQDIPAEQSVLGSIVRDNSVLPDVQRVIATPEEFYTDAHRKIYRAISQLAEQKKPIDLVTLGDQLHQNGHVEDIGGYGYLAQIYDATPAAANAVYYARIVADQCIKRNLEQGLVESLRMIRTGSAVDVVADIQKRLTACVNGHWEKAKNRFREDLPAPAKTGGVEPFPLAVLPQRVRNYVTELAVAMKGPIDFAAVSVLAAASIAIGATRAVHVINPWDELGNLYMAIVAEPGSKKSPMQQQVMRPLYRINKRLRHEHEEESQRYATEMELWNESRSAARHSTSENTTIRGKPQKPHRKRLVTTNATTEVLARILYRNPRGAGLDFDELSALMGALDQYKEGGKGNDRQFFLSAWTCRSTTWDRVNLEGVPLELDKPYLPIIGGIQPDMLETLCGEKKANDGFVDRFLFCWPHETPEPQWSWEELHPGSQDVWTNVVENLWKIPMGANDDGPICVVGQMTPRARSLWEERYNEHVAETMSAELPAVLKFPWHKMKQYALRLAVVVHWLRWACGDFGAYDNGMPVSPDAEPAHQYDDMDIDAGWELIRYFKSHARRVHLRLKASPNDNRCEKAYQQIQAKGGTINMREAMRTHLVGIQTRDDAYGLFRAMESRGMGKMRNETNQNGTLSVNFDLIQPE